MCCCEHLQLQVMPQQDRLQCTDSWHVGGQMGPMSRDEKIMTAVMLGAVVLWVAGDSLGVASVVAAMLGLSALLLTGVLTWRDCLTYSQVLRARSSP